MDRKFLIVLAVAVAALVGIFMFSSSKTDAPAATNASPSNHITGNTSAKVALLEYGDFQCPACAQYFPIVQEIKTKYKDSISFAFRHFPLDTIHPNARAASRAAEAAGLQGKFFEMHDLLYQNQNAWSSLNDPRSIFDGYAKQLGLDMTKFDTDYKSEAVNATINADYEAGKAVGVNSTPTFLINGKKIDNSELTTVEKFSAQIDAALNAAQ